MIRGIIFDMDGTIIDTNPYIYELWNDFVFKKTGQKISKIDLGQQLGKSGDVVHADLEGICRQLSTSLRAGVDPWYCVDQLDGIGSSVSSGPSREGEVTSIPDGVGRALKKYLMAVEKHGIKDVLLGNIDYDVLVGELSDDLKKGTNGNGISSTNEEQKNIFGVKCPSCGRGTLIFQEGCKKCSACGYSAC